jgi:hypothetical protein
VRTSAIFEPTQLYFLERVQFCHPGCVSGGQQTAIVLSQFRQIGILKAIGFTQNQILVLYLANTCIELTGSLGLGLGLSWPRWPLRA